jgi:hypothetical protein
MGLVGACLTLRKFHEHECLSFPVRLLNKVDEYFWKLPKGLPYVPLSFVLEAEAAQNA